MSRSWSLSTLVCVSAGLSLVGQSGLQAQAAPKEIKPHAGMMRFPDVSATHIAFVYATQVWVVPREGGLAVPVANPPGSIVFPRFSPDGKTLAVSANYEGNRDLYTIPVEGGIPTRLTFHPNPDTLCDWTNDGRLIFNTNGYAGLARQQQLFTVSMKGGMPNRLAVPYGEDAALSPDGRWLTYTPHSTVNRTWKRYRGGMATDIWLFDLQEKKSKKLTDWEGTDATPMWHGSHVYYLTDNGPEHRLNIWRYDTKSGRREPVTKFTDFDVRWPAMGPGPRGGGEIVFLYGSELRLLDLPTNKWRAVEVRIPGDRPTMRPKTIDTTRFATNYNVSPTGKRAVIEARGDIWTAPVKDGVPRNLTRTSGVAERDPSWSPDGRWIAYFADKTGEYELYILQSDGRGETKQLTKDGKTFRYTPKWSPDSKKILFTDKSGALYLHTIATGQTKLIDTDPQGNPISAEWSPDGRWLTYAKNVNQVMSTIWIANVETGEKKQVTSGMFPDSSPVFDRKGDYLYFVSSRSFRPTYEDLGTTWVYAGTQVILAAPLRPDVASPYLPKSEEETWKDETKKVEGTADAPKNPLALLLDPNATLPIVAADDADPISGDWTGTVAGSPQGDLQVKMTLTLGANNAVTGSIDAGMGAATIVGKFDPATKSVEFTIAIPNGPTIPMKGTINGATLMASGEVMGVTITLKADRIKAAVPKPAPQAGNSGASGARPEAAPVKVNIEFTDFESRVIPLPVRPGQFGRLAVNNRGHLLFARLAAPGAEEGAGLKLFDINDQKKEEKAVAPGAFAFEITPDGSKLLILRGNSATIQDAAAGATGEAVVTAGMTATIDPQEEWKQIFHDAWRVQRDFFYDPYMHGVNWNAVRDQYAKLLNDLSSREDLSFLIGEMIGELNAGHAYYFGGDTKPEPTVSVGLLGADFELTNGAYRISRIYKGGVWDVDARGPLSQPGVKVKEGDYLLAVNGLPIDTTKDIYAAFQGMADKVVTLTVSEKPKPDSSAREIPVQLLGNETTLRYRAWIERNRAYVEKMSGGKVGYIYVPNTGRDGQTDLFRQFVGQSRKEALIIDERWNGGGQIPTRFIELLNRPATNYFAIRDGQDWMWPPDSHQGPKCMLINGLAGSGGDAFPWYFRQSKLGKLIGTRTWGGLIGISGYPPLVDGATTTAPMFAFYKKDGTWGVEGHGVDPDIEVLDDPALMVNGGDPQLDAAIKLMLDEIKRNPYTPPKRPPYADRSKMGLPDKDK